jgi:hypothetical protein
MIVKGMGFITLCGLALTMLAVVPSSFAANADDLQMTKIIGIVPFTKAGVTQEVYHNIDRIVPELKKLAPERIIKLECSYTGLAEHEQDVLSAYMIAGRVEKYLREHHKLNLDLWMAAHVNNPSRQQPIVITFSVFPEDAKNVNKMPVDPAMVHAE